MTAPPPELDASVSQVYKMQRPIGTLIPQSEILIYNEDRSIEFFLPATEELLALFWERDAALRLFVLGRIVDTIFNIDEVVDDPGWDDPFTVVFHPER